MGSNRYRLHAVESLLVQALRHMPKAECPSEYEARIISALAFLMRSDARAAWLAEVVRSLFRQIQPTETQADVPGRTLRHGHCHGMLRLGVRMPSILAGKPVASSRP